MKADISMEKKIDEFTEEDRANARRALEQLDELSVALDLGPFDFEQFKSDRDLGRL